MSQKNINTGRISLIMILWSINIHSIRLSIFENLIRLAFVQKELGHPSGRYCQMDFEHHLVKTNSPVIRRLSQQTRTHR